jgi:hypothetical protein
MDAKSMVPHEKQLIHFTGGVCLLLTSHVASIPLVTKLTRSGARVRTTPGRCVNECLAML